MTAATEKKKLTLEDIIAKKLEKQNKRNKKGTFYVESLGGQVEYEVPDESTLLRAMDKFEAGSMEKINDAYVYLIYNSVPIIRNPELHEAYEVVDPLDIVSKVFELKERMNLGEKILKLAKLDEIGEDVKN